MTTVNQTPKSEKILDSLEKRVIKIQRNEWHVFFFHMSGE